MATWKGHEGEILQVTGEIIIGDTTYTLYKMTENTANYILACCRGNLKISKQ